MIAKIIEFLLSNIFIVVIIIGALASMFGKGGSKNRKRSPEQVPGGRERQSPAGEDWRQERVEQPEDAPAQTVYRSELHASQEAAAASREREEEARRLAGERSALERRLRQAAAQKERELRQQSAAPSAPASSTVGKEKLRNAVIWAEILGPPRAKRHYRK